MFLCTLYYKIYAGPYMMLYTFPHTLTFIVHIVLYYLT